MMVEINQDNYFEVAEAIHAFCGDWHSGQTSELYSILSQSEFHPGPLWSSEKVELENEIYPLLTEDNVSELFGRLRTFLENL